MGLFDWLFGRKREDAESPRAAADLSSVLDRLGPVPEGNGDPRAAAARAAERASPPPREAVRLRPIVPIPTERPWRSWLGGSPRLPEPFTWPHGDGKPFHFVAQVDCSELPAGLWLGTGPRRGWLAFFVGVRNGRYAAEVVHARSLGPERPAPAPWDRDFAQLLYHRDAPADWRLDPPCWPVEVLVQREGEPDVWRSTFQRETPEEPSPRAGEVIDLARAEYQPHDWETLRALLGIMRDRVARHGEQVLRRLTAELGAQNAPPRDREVPATIRAEAVSAAERFAALDAARSWEPELWVPYAQAAARWRTLHLQVELESGAPLPMIAAKVWHFATALIRAVPSFGPHAKERKGPADPEAYRRLTALQPECFARWQEMRSDPRLPPELVGEGGARRTNEDGYRAFRAEQPEVWSALAAPLRATFAELAHIETALQLRKKPDPYGTPASTYSHDWPQSRDDAAALLRGWVDAAGRDLAAAEAPRPDRSAQAAAARAELAADQQLESALASMAERAAAGRATGVAMAWDEWRAPVEDALATNALRHSRAGVLSTWNQLRSAVASRAYARSPAAPALPAPVLGYFLERWRYDARFELACMGGASQGYTDLVEPEDDRTQLLLELPDSRLFGWQWGDADNLIVAMPLDALRRGDFGSVVAGVTNGGR